VTLENLTFKKGNDLKSEKSTLEKLICSIILMSIELITLNAKGLRKKMGNEKPKTKIEKMVKNAILYIFCCHFCLNQDKHWAEIIHNRFQE
jgi:hypothetical protein